MHPASMNDVRNDHLAWLECGRTLAEDKMNEVERKCFEKVDDRIRTTRLDFHCLANGKDACGC